LSFLRHHRHVIQGTSLVGIDNPWRYCIEDHHGIRLDYKLIGQKRQKCLGILRLPLLAAFDGNELS
jgi:hypothetical protein